MAPTFGPAHIEFEKDQRSAAISLKHQRQTKRGREVMLLALSLTPPVKRVEPVRYRSRNKMDTMSEIAHQMTAAAGI
jgi:hypothetical protein